MLDKRRSQTTRTLKNCYQVVDQTSCPPIVVCYIAVTDGAYIDAYAPRFARTYQEFPADFPHRLVIVCNGGRLTDRRRAFFDGLKCDFLERPNDAGWDISGFQHVAALNQNSLICCFGESVYFHRTGWLRRLAKARSEFGPGMYGVFSSHNVRAHLNTTGFMADARLIEKYPAVLNHGARYEFEHGHQCFWKRIHAGGHTAALVTWNGYWFPGEWRDPENIMHRGDQSNLLAWCNHTERWATADPATRSAWSAQSNSVFRL